MATVCSLFRVMARASWNGVGVERGEMRGSVTLEDIKPRFDHRLLKSSKNTLAVIIKALSELYPTGNNFSLAAF